MLGGGQGEGAGTVRPKKNAGLLLDLRAALLSNINSVNVPMYRPSETHKVSLVAAKCIHLRIDVERETICKRYMCTMCSNTVATCRNERISSLRHSE